MQERGNRPEDFERDLNPDGMAGRNAGPADSQAEKEAPTAYDRKELRQALDWLDDSELANLPVLESGTRLRQGATYVDLRSHDRSEFTAIGDMTAGSSNWYVPKNEVDYQLWNRLIGVAEPERRGEADEG